MAEHRETIQPIVIELGKVGRGKIKDLKRGRGQLLGHVAQALSETEDKLGAGAQGKVLVPIVFVCRKKAKKRGLGIPFAPW